MKKFLGFFCFCAMIFASCSLDDGNSKGKITFSIDKNALSSQQNRSVTTSGVNTDEKRTLEIQLKGDFEESATVEISNGAVVSFDDIPVGSEIYAEAYLSRESATQKTEYYMKGKSSTVKIKSGENSIFLKMHGRTYGSLNANGGSFKEINLDEKNYYAYNSINGTVRFGGFQIPLASELGLTREDYTFMGWATKSGGNVVYADGEEIYSETDLTLYAVWSQANYKYTIIFDANGGKFNDGSTTKKIGADTTDDLNAKLTNIYNEILKYSEEDDYETSKYADYIPTRSEYDLKGISTSKNGNTLEVENLYNYIIQIIFTNSVTVYAVWDDD